MPIAMGRSARRLTPPNAAMCRRSLGQILGQPCFRRPYPPGSEDPLRGHTHLTYDLIWWLFLAKPARSVRPILLPAPFIEARQRNKCCNTFLSVP
jgi:hypothetical protein